MLGEFFEITLPGIKDPKVMGITCFHLINPTEKDRRYKATTWKWCKEGIAKVSVWLSKMALALLSSTPQVRWSLAAATQPTGGFELRFYI